jgi:beta-lactamase regulating signal transducer with metallopeptidase domain
MTFAIALEIALKSALIAGAALALLAVLKRLPAAQRAFVAHIGLALALMTPIWVLFGPRLEMTGPWSRAPAPLSETATIVTPMPAHPLDPIQQSAPMLDSGALAFGFYALIAGLLLAALAVSLWRLLRLQHDASVLTDPSWLCALAQAQQRMGMKQGTALLQNECLSSPVSWGLLRPTIMVNPAILMSSDKAEAVLAHELAHVIRMDWLNLLIARLATAVLWFNPLVWLLAWQAHELREEAADDVVLRGDVRRADYAALLVDFARRERASPLAAAHGVSPAKDALKRRLARVLDPNVRRDPAAPVWATTCAAAALLIAAPVAAFSPIDHAPQRSGAFVAAHQATPATAAAAHALAKGEAFAAVAQADEPSSAAATATPVRDERLTANALIAMHANGVTVDYIERIERAYPPARTMGYEELISFRVLGVTPEWLGGVVDAGYPNLRPDHVHSLAALGVTPEYIRELRAAGLRANIDDLISLHANGVRADYVRELRDAGLTDLSASEIISLAAHGVSPAEVRGLAPRGEALEGGPSSGRPPDARRSYLPR